MVMVLGVAARMGFAQPDSIAFDFSFIDEQLVDDINHHAFIIRESNPQLALRYSHSALEIAEEIGYQRGRANALSTMGWIHYRQTNMLSALELSIEAYSLSEKIGALSETFLSGTTIAAVYNQQRQYDRSIGQLVQLLATAKRLNNNEYISRTLNNLSYNYIISGGSLDSAYAFASEALTIASAGSDEYLRAFALRNLGDIHHRRKNFSKAIEIFSEGIVSASAGKSHTLVSQLQRRQAESYIELRSYDKARAVIMQAIEAAESNGSLEELSIGYQLLARLDYKTGRVGEAYRNLNAYQRYLDSINEVNKVNLVTFLQSQYENRLEKAKIDLLTREAQLNAELIRNQKNQTRAYLLGAIALLVLFVVVLIYSIRLGRTKRQVAAQRQALSDKNVELQAANATKDKMFSIIGHDLRSPLYNLSGILKLLKSKDITKNDFDPCR